MTRVLVSSALLLGLLGCSRGSSEGKPATGPAEDTGATDPTGGDTGSESDSTDSGDSDPVDYTSAGPSTAGATAFTATLTSGTTPALVWYPTTDTGSPIEYFASIEGTAVEGAGASCDELRPVVVHSHGNGSAAFEMAWLAEYLATHGVITVAIDHVGNNYYEQTSDFLRLYEQRPTDISELYDLLLRELAAPGELLDGCVDPDAGYVVSGYSFGGYTAYAVAGARVNNTAGTPTYDFGDSRVKAVMAYAPWDGGGALTEGMGEVDVPAFTVGAARDLTVFQQYTALHGGLTSTPRILGEFPDAGHYTFIEWCNIYLFTDGCGAGWVDLDVFRQQVQQSAAAFVGHVEGDADALETLASEAGVVSWTVTEE